MLLKQPDGSVAREDWVRLMECLRPDCNADHVSERSCRLGGALFLSVGGVENGAADECREESPLVSVPVLFSRGQRKIAPRRANLSLLSLVIVVVVVVQLVL